MGRVFNCGRPAHLTVLPTQQYKLFPVLDLDPVIRYHRMSKPSALTLYVLGCVSGMAQGWGQFHMDLELTVQFQFNSGIWNWNWNLKIFTQSEFELQLKYLI